MNDELKQLIEDAAKLIGLPEGEWFDNYDVDTVVSKSFVVGDSEFNPLDPERGDLMKVAMAAELRIDYHQSEISGFVNGMREFWGFTKGNYQSLALAILRAASTVLHSRGGV